MIRDDPKGRKQPELALRLREIRQDLYGEFGAQALADALEIPVDTWLNYERGVTMPAHVVLKLIVIAQVNPHWLLTGQGEPHEYQSCERNTGRSLF
jgi:DNA-binding transcriptional regulator YiaG